MEPAVVGYPARSILSFIAMLIRFPFDEFLSIERIYALKGSSIAYKNYESNQ